MKLITDKNSLGLVNKEFVEYLKTPIEKTETTAIEASELHETLETALNTFGGIGISATQLGIKKRACLIKFGDENIFLLNPIITERSKDGFIFYEGCLSMPDTMKKPVRTLRANYVVVQTDNLGEIRFEINTEEDRKGEQVSADTMKTVIVQHEIDHLDGITIKDRVYSTTIVKKQEYGRNDKIVMKSPEGELVEVKFKKANDLFLKGYEVV